MDHRHVLLLCVLLALGAGCVTSTDQGTQPGESPTATAGTHTDTPASTAHTESPASTAGIPDREARERALTAEREYVTTRLENASCVREWGLTAYGGIDENATVTDRAADGVRVAVTHPYWYSTAQDEVDGGSSARYRVGADSIRRLNGDAVSPC